MHFPIIHCIYIPIRKVKQMCNNCPQHMDEFPYRFASSKHHSTINNYRRVTDCVKNALAHHLSINSPVEIILRSSSIRLAILENNRLTIDIQAITKYNQELYDVRHSLSNEYFGTSDREVNYRDFLIEKAKLDALYSTLMELKELIASGEAIQ